MSNYDSREDFLRRDLGITWNDTPAPVQEDYADVSEDAKIRYNIAANEDKMREIEQQKALDEQFANMNAEQVRAAWEIEAAKETARTLPARQAEAARQFICESPEFVLSPRNQDYMDKYFQVAKLDASDPDHFHQAYRALASRGLIQVDENRRPRTPRKQLTQADLEAMPIEQLRELADQQMRRR
jgi:hypothetical protein